MKQIILVSSSPRRKEIFSKSGLNFKTISPDYKENMNSKLKPLELAKFLSKGKANSVVKKYRNHIIIGADTFIVLTNKLLGKPHTTNEAKKMLKSISNKTLRVITGFTIIDTGSNKSISKAIQTKVYIKKLTNEEINNYIKTKEPLDKAGAFAIQGTGALVVKKIEGDYFNVMGLPLFSIMQELKKFGIYVL